MVARARRSPPPSPPGSSSGRISLPALVSDPIWSLRPWSVQFEVAGYDFEIPAMPAADWLAVLMGPQFRPDDIVPGMLPEEEQRDIDVLLHNGSMDIEEYLNLGLEVLSEVCGRPWWVAMRLVNVARSSWDALGGQLVRKADAERLSIAGWLDVLFPLVAEGLDESKREMFLLKLEVPPEGWGNEPESMEMTADAFLAMA